MDTMSHSVTGWLISLVNIDTAKWKGTKDKYSS